MRADPEANNVNTYFPPLLFNDWAKIIRKKKKLNTDYDGRTCGNLPLIIAQKLAPC